MEDLKELMKRFNDLHERVAVLEHKHGVPKPAGPHPNSGGTDEPPPVPPRPHS